jgi:aldehyde:ferredoxin oxidoreductase
MDGFYNKVLHIDLSTRSYKEESIEDEVYRNYLGGKGLGTHLLINHTKAVVDPLSEDNVLIFAIGPIADTMVWGSSRFAVFTKSPLTGFYTESYAGGTAAQPISRTGYDAMIIRGKSKEPIYLEISDTEVTFHDASHLWGKDTYETEDIIAQEIEVKDLGTVVIGPAGENLVRFSLMQSDRWRSIGRTGAGAVAGSKKLKGIAFHGKKKKEIAKPELLKEFRDQISEVSKTDKGVAAYKAMGTLQMVPLMNQGGGFPTKYWTMGTYPRWRNLTREALGETCNVTHRSCPRCFVACEQVGEVREGRHKGLTIKPEYETIDSFGGLCMIDDIREILYLNDICNRLGMDTITAGNLCGFTIEASHRKDTGFKLDYGDVDGIADLLRKTVKKEGIGAVLAEGIRYASKEWGLEDLAIHVKGLEPPGYDPRVYKGMGLGYAISDRGACHLRATFYKPELAGMIAPDAVEGKAEMFLWWEDKMSFMDSLIACRFYRDLYTWEGMSTMVEAITGMKLDEKRIREIASNITSKAREFNLREEMKREDERLPKRLLEEPLEDSGKTLSGAEFEKMLSEYYELKGWNEPPSFDS